MDIGPFVESVRRDLINAAAVGGESAQTLAGNLATALESAVRLAVVDALSQAAAEITTEMPGGSVEVRLRGRDPEFVVTERDLPVPPTIPLVPPVPPIPLVPPVPPVPPEEDGLARITLRIPESVKANAEACAELREQSLNTWLLAAVRRAVVDEREEIESDQRRPGRHGRRDGGRRDDGGRSGSGFRGWL